MGIKGYRASLFQVGLVHANRGDGWVKSSNSSLIFKEIGSRQAREKNTIINWSEQGATVASRAESFHSVLHNRLSTQFTKCHLLTAAQVLALSQAILPMGNTHSPCGSTRRDRASWVPFHLNKQQSGWFTMLFYWILFLALFV